MIAPGHCGQDSRCWGGVSFVHVDSRRGISAAVVEASQFSINRTATITLVAPVWGRSPG